MVIINKSIFSFLAKDREGVLDRTKLVKLLLATKYIDCLYGSLPSYDSHSMYLFIKKYYPTIKDTPELPFQVKYDYEKAERHFNHLKNIDVKYYNHEKNWDWMYRILKKYQFSFSRGKGIRQTIKTEELVNFCMIMTRKLINQGGSAIWARKYFVTWKKDNLNFKLSYNKLSGILNALEHLWLIKRTGYELEKPRTYSLGCKNPFLAFLDVPKTKCLKVRKPIIISGFSPIQLEKIHNIDIVLEENRFEEQEWWDVAAERLVSRTVAAQISLVPSDETSDPVETNSVGLILKLTGGLY